MHWSDTTAPLPLFPHMAASQPQPVRVPPWWRRIRRALLALLAALPLFVIPMVMQLLGGR